MPCIRACTARLFYRAVDNPRWAVLWLHDARREPWPFPNSYALPARQWARLLLHDQDFITLAAWLRQVAEERLSILVVSVDGVRAASCAAALVEGRDLRHWQLFDDARVDPTSPTYINTLHAVA